jgi:hypothetical protein
MDDPMCERCGAPVTTGAMAVFCPRQDCEFIPPEGLPDWMQAWRDESQLSGGK